MASALVHKVGCQTENDGCKYKLCGTQNEREEARDNHFGGCSMHSRVRSYNEDRFFDLDCVRSFKVAESYGDDVESSAQGMMLIYTLNTLSQPGLHVFLATTSATFTTYYRVHSPMQQFWSDASLAARSLPLPVVQAQRGVKQILYTCVSVCIWV